MLPLPRSDLERWLIGAIALLALASLSLALRPDSTVFMQPLSEDGFYSLAVARSIAAGHGVTIDGTMRTNGFQPLLTFLQAGLFRIAGGNDLTALRLVLLLYWLLYLGTGAMLGRIAAETAGEPAERRRRGLATMLLYLGASYLFLHHFNGLETGLLLFLLAAAWRYRQSARARGWAGAALLGALLGLAVLARIDAGSVVAVLCLGELWAHRKDGAVLALGRPVVIGAAATLVSLPWWVYCYEAFGSVMPTSGQATQAWGIDGFRLGWILWGGAMGAFPWLFGGEAEGSQVLDLIRLPLYASGLWVLWRSYRAMPAASREFAALLAVAMALLAAWYWLGSGAYWFYSRYLSPLSLPVAVGLGLGLAPLLGRWPRFAAPAATVLLTVPVVVLAALAWEGRGLYGEIMFRDQVELVRAQVPAGDTVAAGQSGTLNFFRPHVVNMDGVVNPEVLDYLDHRWDYLAKKKIRWFADWPNYVAQVLGDNPEEHGWKLVASRGKFRLYRRQGP